MRTMPWTMKAAYELRASLGPGQPPTEMTLRCAQQPDRSEHGQQLDGSEGQGRPVPASKELLKHSKLCRKEPQGGHSGGGSQCDEAALPAESVRTTVNHRCLEAAMPRANSAMQAGHSHTLRSVKLSLPKGKTSRTRNVVAATIPATKSRRRAVTSCANAARLAALNQRRQRSAAQGRPRLRRRAKRSTAHPRTRAGRCRGCRSSTNSSQYDPGAAPSGWYSAYMSSGHKPKVNTANGTPSRSSRSAAKRPWTLALQRRPRQQPCDEEQQRDHEQREGPDHGEQDYLGHRREGGLLHIGVGPELVKTDIGEHTVNRNNHCNQDHLEVVKVPLPVPGPSFKIKMTFPGSGDPSRLSRRCHLFTVAPEDGEHKCRTALFPEGTGPDAGLDRQVESTMSDSQRVETSNEMTSAIERASSAADLAFLAMDTARSAAVRSDLDLGSAGRFRLVRAAQAHLKAHPCGATIAAAVDQSTAGMWAFGVDR